MTSSQRLGLVSFMNGYPDLVLGRTRKDCRKYLLQRFSSFCPNCFRKTNDVFRTCGKVHHGTFKRNVFVARDLLPNVGNPEWEHEWMKESIRQWLDEEWQPQTVHEEIGNQAASMYLNLREQGEDHMGSLLLELGTKLQKVDFKDAFVDSFTVANKVIELLIDRKDQENVNLSSNETMECFKREKPDKKDVELLGEHFASGFNRYKFLSCILEDNISETVVHTAVLFCLGYDFDSVKNSWYERNVKSETSQFFSRQGNYSDILQSPEGLAFLESQLPKDEETRRDLDGVIDEIAGEDYAKFCRKEGNEEFRRSAILVKWLYHVGGWMTRESLIQDGSQSMSDIGK
eukprot:jgi/Galph1/2648/GphlegSOOS_G1289.1